MDPHHITEDWFMTREGGARQEAPRRAAVRRRGLLSGLLVAGVLGGTTGAASANDCVSEEFRATAPADAFEVVGEENGFVVDTRTGLMWPRCAYGQHWRPEDNRCLGIAVFRDWGEALRLAAEYEGGGYTDWRLPDRKELGSLVERCRVDPALNPEVFPDAPTGTFWSSTPIIDTDFNVWGISFADGTASWEGVAGFHRFRPVRSAE